MLTNGVGSTKEQQGSAWRVNTSLRITHVSLCHLALPRGNLVAEMDTGKLRAPASLLFIYHKWSAFCLYRVLWRLPVTAASGWVGLLKLQHLVFESTIRHVDGLPIPSYG